MIRAISRSLSILASVVVLWAAIGSPALLAQSMQGSISGTVTDPSGAVIPKVTITATNVRTNFTRTALSSEAGLYELPSLDPSEYTIRAEASGFKTYVNQNVPLGNREGLRIDIRLEVGAVTAEVTVHSQAPVVRTEDAKLDLTLTRKYLEIRPTNSAHGYGITGIEATRSLPGVYYTRLFGEEGSAVMVTGARSTETQVNINGIKQLAFQTYNAPLSGVQEVKIERFNTPAEYATPATVEITLRGGERSYHGEVLMDVRNPKLNAGNFFAPRARVGTPSYALVANFGGPVYIPKLYPHKDKTFFFFTHERNKRSEGVYTRIFNYPTVDMRNGNFSTLRIGGKPVTVIDPLTGQPFPNNTIPAGRFSDVSKKILALYPLPNQGDPTDPVRNFQGDTPYGGGIGIRSWRADHNLTSKQTLTFAWGQARLPQHQDIAAGGTIGGVLGLYESVSVFSLDSPSLAWTYTITPSLVNEFRIGMLRVFQSGAAGPLGLSGRGIDWLSQMGIQGIAAPDGMAMPSVSIKEVYPIQGISQSRTARNYWTLIDNFSLQVGKHSLKVGTNVHIFQSNVLGVPGAAYGNLDFTGRFTGVGFADFLLGIPETTSLNTPRPEIGGRYKSVGFYLQDKWTITPKLTFTYGLRNDFWTIPRDAQNTYFNFDPKTQSVVVPDQGAVSKVHPQWPQNIPVITAAQAGFPPKLRRLSYLNLSPRLALAWRPWGDKTALRMGFGVYHSPVTLSSFVPFTGGPFAVAQTFLNTFDPATKQFLFQFPRVTPATIGPGLASPGTIGFSAINTEADKIPYVMQWNFTIDRQIVRDTRLSVSYLGSKVTQLMYGRNINVPAPSTIPFTQSRRPYPLFSGITWFESGGNQTYESLEVMLFRRLSSGFQFEGGWIWSNALNDVADSGSDLGPTIRNPFCRRCEKGPQEDVVQHAFKGTFLWEPPIGRQRRFLANVHPVLNGIIGGWVTSNAFEFRTGDWLTPIYTGRDISNTSITSGVPDRVCDGNISGPKNFRSKVADLSCFVIPAAGIGRFGNSGRGIIEGPNNKFWNLAVYKEFPIGEHLKFRVGMQTQNIWNWLGLGFHNTNIVSPIGMEATGSGKGMPSGRNIELQAKLSF